MCDAQRAPDVLDDILSEAEKVLPFNPKRHEVYEFYVVMSFRLAEDWESRDVGDNESQSSQAVLAIAAPPSFISQAWLDRYQEKLDKYKRAARAVSVTIVRVSKKSAKAPKISKTRRGKSKARKARSTRHRSK